MLIKNAKILIEKEFIEGDILFSDKIEAIGQLDGNADFDAQGNYIIPGLVDIHTHGALGEDFSDGNPPSLQTLSDYYISRGVTSYLATTMTLGESELSRALHAIRNFERRDGAKCEGVHLEGPFLSYEKRGAQNAENLCLPDFALFCRLNEESGNNVRMVTIAPETKGAIAFIKKVSQNCVVSLGHTAADYDTAMAAFAAGATHVTHLFNGMNPYLHRAPGVLGAAYDSGASVELICDGHHIHPSVIRGMFGLFGEKVNLISDSIRSAGMPDGNYELGGQPVVMREGKATLLDGVLAGSSISLLDGVRNAVKFGIGLEQAVYSASTAPALAVGLKRGAIKVGRPADLVVLDESLRLTHVFVDGRKWEKS